MWVSRSSNANRSRNMKKGSSKDGEVKTNSTEEAEKSSTTMLDTHRRASPPANTGMTSSQISDAPRPRSASPPQLSAASSLIFERNVQESTLSPDVAPGIPAHIKTEDQIPPALEASSLAITDNHLGPEEVEIVTHTAHQPAAAIIAESIPSAHQSVDHLALSPQDSQHESIASPTHHEGEDVAQNYGTLDPNDVRRLSFISFADVVHGEHAETGSIHSLHHLPLSSATDIGQHQSPNPNRPISPTRSPLSSFSQPLSPDVTTPPTTASGPGSAKGVELSPARSLNASPVGSPHQHGGLAIETLGQALRKTASRDLSGFNRSPPASAV
ncbi:hypothetical protein BDZ85DRAFT_273314 [Elsinoe ampelina]|uniref:Uncharacterized protein n=1 Tax=Elsinoe ampelina TaxID=302913 RepID=A0A6A6GEJ4_9PEZI|nr:hypothetical protein BDZ85DRAFT_273314 [Elsinoe ampelina]